MNEGAPVVTMAALYGTAGSIIGAKVAERVGVRFLDRPALERAGHLDDAGLGVDEDRRTRRDRLVEGLDRLSTITGGTGGTNERLDAEEHHRRRQVEEFLGEASRSGGVAMGGGGMVVLRSVPWALHVHLGGPVASRVAQAMALEGIDRHAAEARQRAADRARRSYVRRAYGVDGADPAWYHLMLDATALDVDTCVEVIATAALSRARDPRPTAQI